MDENCDGNSKKKRAYYWETAIGLNKVDGLTPSDYLLELKEDSIDGLKSYVVIENELDSYYKKQEKLTAELLEKRECDVVSTRIAKILESRDFVLSPVMLLNIHKRLFEGVFSNELAGYEGRFRDYNISKAERILNGKSVIYADYTTIAEYLKYDFDNESSTGYSKSDRSQNIKKLARFVSSIWQVHPFVEGNTRTTAVFLEKYMMYLGYDNIGNTMFKDASVYFRSALVLSNYTDLTAGIKPDFRYLEAFLTNLVENGTEPLPEITVCKKLADNSGL